MAQTDDDGQGERRSWLTAGLDPVDGLRALADAQGFGRRLVEELADRIQAGGADGTSPVDGPASDRELVELIHALRADAVRAGQVWTDLLDSAAAVAGLALGRLAGPGRRGAAADTVVLESTAGGAELVGTFWVHNTSPAPVPAVRPHCAPLRSHLGCELPADLLRFDPVMLDPLPGRSSCGIEVRLRVPRTTSPGCYVSVILATNVPELYLPVRADVEVVGET
jgi:hypothetical protein